MDRFKYLLLLTAYSTLLALSTHIQAAEQTVNIPCPVFKTGYSWEYALNLPMGPATQHTVVLAAHEHSIRLADKTELDNPVARGTPGPASSDLQQSEVELEDSGTMVSMKHSKTGPIAVDIEPGQPICGDVPAHWTGSTKTTMGTIIKEVPTTLNFVARGKETVTVPAGTFEATVVEISRPAAANSATPNSPGVSSVQVMYAVPGVGFVKMRQFTTIPIPQVSANTADHAEIEALLQEGIKKMQRGEDTADVMKRVSELNAQAQDSASSTNSNTIRNESVRVLKKFVQGPPQ